MPYVEVNGISAFYDVSGDGPPVLFLHGGLCSAEVMRALSQELHDHRVFAPERPGHGRTPDRPGPFHYDQGVQDTLAFMDAVALHSVHVVGFSDGANIGLMLALAHPERVRSLVNISGNIDAGMHVYDLDHAMPEEQLVLIGAENDRLSPDGPDHQQVVEERITQMWRTEPHISPESLGHLDLPVMVMAADADVIALEHTRFIHHSIKKAQLAIIPGASHMLVREQPRLVGLIIGNFLSALDQES